jgi:peroxiredoxin Q/BCP
VSPAEQGNVVAQLKVGAKAPAFTLNDQAGKKVKLSDFKGRRVVVYFYPKADTPGCTNQACSVQEALPMMRRLKAQVLGISPDPPEKQQKFANVADAWGTWGDRTLYGRKFKGIIRSAFVIDEQGKVEATFYKVSPKDTVPKVTATLKAT